MQLKSDLIRWSLKFDLITAPTKILLQVSSDSDDSDDGGLAFLKGTSYANLRDQMSTAKQTQKPTKKEKQQMLTCTDDEEEDKDDEEQAEVEQLEEQDDGDGGMGNPFEHMGEEAEGEGAESFAEEIGVELEDRVSGGKPKGGKKEKKNKKGGNKKDGKKRGRGGARGSKDVPVESPLQPKKLDVSDQKQSDQGVVGSDQGVAGSDQGVAGSGQGAVFDSQPPADSVDGIIAEMEKLSPEKKVAKIEEKKIKKKKR